MNNKKLKEEFIKYFGEEKWNEEEILSVIQPFANYVCESYIGLSPVPVLFDDLIIILPVMYIFQLWCCICCVPTKIGLFFRLINIHKYVCYAVITIFIRRKICDKYTLFF